MKTVILILSLGPAVPAVLAQSTDRPVYASEPVRASVEDDHKADKPPRCLGATASRIRRPIDPCQSPGRRIDADAIDATGEIDLGNALRKLDPAISGQR